MDSDTFVRSAQRALSLWYKKLEAESVDEAATLCAEIGRRGFRQFYATHYGSIDDMLRMKAAQRDQVICSYVKKADRLLLICVTLYRLRCAVYLMETLSNRAVEFAEGFDHADMTVRCARAADDLKDNFPDYWVVDNYPNPFDLEVVK